MKRDGPFAVWKVYTRTPLTSSPTHLSTLPVALQLLFEHSQRHLWSDKQTTKQFDDNRMTTEWWQC